MINPVRIDDYINADNSIEFDNLVTAISYEDRCFLSLEKIIDNFIFKNVFILVFESDYLDQKLLEKWKFQKKNLLNYLEEKDITPIEIECNPVLFKDTITRLLELIDNETDRNFINITTLPKNYILRLAKEFDNKENIFFYCRTSYRRPSDIELRVCR